jgi:FAD/FMN-containing dehydrogenase
MRRLLRWHDVNKLSQDRSGQLKYSPDQLAAFSSRLIGRIVTPQDAAYKSAREGFLSTFQHYPQIIVYAAGFSDVAAAIAFAREVDLHPVCRAGGHSTAGYSVNDEMVIDVSGINYARVDQRNKAALVGAGANFAQLDANLEYYGLHIPGAGCETVCVGGYMQGGGYGFTSQIFGMNCDMVAGVQVALANGRIVTANSTENDDLFWAVRGGTGNNFGVLLEVEYRLEDLGQLWGFGFRWPIGNDAGAEAAAKAAAVWQENFTGNTAPPKIGQQAALVRLPMGCKRSPRQTIPYFVVRGMFNGGEADCRKVLDPLFELIRNESYRDIWRSSSYRDLNNSLLSDPVPMPNVPVSSRVLAKSHIVERNLTKDEWRTIVELFRHAPEDGDLIGMEAYGGAVNAKKPEDTAFWHRRASMNVFLYSFWLFDEIRAAAEEYVREFDLVLAPLANGHSYQNYPNRDIHNFGHQYFGGNLRRLLAVKQKYDPERLFTFPQGVDNAAAIS